jgi:peptidoglycan/xylan/chitin deacetylase (PgdA/CDA1 family)
VLPGPSLPRPRPPRPELAAALVAALGSLLIFLAVLGPVATPPSTSAAALPTEAPSAAIEPPPATAAREPPTATAAPPTPIAAPPTAQPTSTSVPVPPTAPTAPPPTVAATPTRVIAPRTASGVPILMYHYIRVNPDPKDEIGFGLSVNPDQFQAHMAFLAERGYKVVAMRDVNEYVGTGKLPSDKWVVLTFDDGYRDAYTEAWPVIKKLGFGATVFMITDLIDNPRYLSADQLKELNAAGVEIGSHSASHPELPQLSAAKLKHEVFDSRDTLVRLLGGPIASFCYPSGHNSAAVRQAVQAAGYASAVTVDPGLFKGKEDRFQIPRVRVYGGMGLASFARALGEPLPDRAAYGGAVDDRPYRKPGR